MQIQNGTFCINRDVTRYFQFHFHATKTRGKLVNQINCLYDIGLIYKELQAVLLIVTKKLHSHPVPHHPIKKYKR